jgi:2-methylcitrate dehydratase PrpD
MVAAKALAEFVARTAYEDLPDAAVEHAKRHLLDILGVGLLGSVQEMPRRALQGILAIPGSKGEAGVWGRDVRLATPFAAMANGIASHVLDFDDTHTEGIVHGSAILGPTVLGLGAELGMTGKDILAAFVLGWEVAARVGLAARGSIHDRGYHTTSIAGVFGAAAAAAKLLDLTDAKLLNAIALAGSQASGINEYQTNGSSSKILHTGWAAHAGIVAAYLARTGMTGPETIFEGGMGLLKVYGEPSRIAAADLTSELGQRWEVTRVGVKPYPCCHFLHAFIDCTRGLAGRQIRPEDIESIECVVPETEVALVCEPEAMKRRPISPYAAKFSLPYAIAATMFDGGVSHNTFTATAIERPEVLDLATRIRYRIADPGETTFPRYFPGWMKASLRGGQLVEERIDINAGTPESPLSREALERKFRDNAGPVLPQGQLETLIQVIWSLEESSACEFDKLMRPNDARSFAPMEAVDAACAATNRI